MLYPTVARRAASTLITVLAGVGLASSASAQLSLQDLHPATPCVERNAGAPLQSNAGTLSIQAPRGMTPQGVTVQAAVGLLLWDQPPPASIMTAILDADDPAVPANAIYQVHDVLFSDVVRVTSIATWFSNSGGTWAGGITQARVNVFTNDPLLASDDPTMGTVVMATATVDGPYIKLEAQVDIGLVAGAYWIGLTPIGDIEGAVGREYHVQSSITFGQQTQVRNGSGAFGFGTDWFPGSDVLSGTPFDGAIRIEGTVVDEYCADDCGPRSNQPPDQFDAYESDVDHPGAVAETWTLNEATELCEVVVWGVYAFGKTAPAGDLFTLIIHEDAAGLPGPVVYSETAIASTRVATGQLIGGLFDEYRYGLVPAERVILSPGTYWFEIFNNTITDADDDWFWETGALDIANGTPGYAKSDAAPGTSWSHRSFDLAMQVCGKAPALQVDCLPGCDATVLQPADGLNGRYSDANGIAGEISIADDFVITEETEVCDITFRGGHAPSNTPDVPDFFTVTIHADRGGAPGPAVYSELGQAPLRVATGALLLGQFDVYEYVFTPSHTLVLPPGVYWLEVFNNTADDFDDGWFWETGTLDPSSIPGHVFAIAAPGVVWLPVTEDLAFRICGKPPEPCVSYCASLPNASGSAAVLTCSGNPNFSLVLTSTPVPNTTGQFFFGPMMLAGSSTLGDGLRCVGGATTRILPFVSAGMMMQLPNTASIALNYTAPYASGLTGTKHFQHWFRSGLGTGTGSNTSNAISVTF